MNEQMKNLKDFEKITLNDIEIGIMNGYNIVPWNDDDAMIDIIEN